MKTLPKRSERRPWKVFAGYWSVQHRKVWFLVKRYQTIWCWSFFQGGRFKMNFPVSSSFTPFQQWRRFVKDDIKLTGWSNQSHMTWQFIDSIISITWLVKTLADGNFIRMMLNHFGHAYFFPTSSCNLKHRLLLFNIFHFYHQLFC